MKPHCFVKCIVIYAESKKKANFKLEKGLGYSSDVKKCIILL